MGTTRPHPPPPNFLFRAEHDGYPLIGIYKGTIKPVYGRVIRAGSVTRFIRNDGCHLGADTNFTPFAETPEHDIVLGPAHRAAMYYAAMPSDRCVKCLEASERRTPYLDAAGRVVCPCGPVIVVPAGRSHRETAIELLRAPRNVASLQHFSPELSSDLEIVKIAVMVRSCSRALMELMYVPDPSVRGHEEVLQAALAARQRSLPYSAEYSLDSRLDRKSFDAFLHSFQLSEQRAVALRAAAVRGSVLAVLSRELCDDDEVVAAACLEDASTLRHASAALRANGAFVLSLVARGAPDVLRHAERTLRSDTAGFMRAAVLRNPKAMKFVPKDGVELLLRVARCASHHARCVVPLIVLRELFRRSDCHGALLSVSRGKRRSNEGEMSKEGAAVDFLLRRAPRAAFRCIARFISLRKGE